ncbi:MAG: SDR family oxidoreductase [Roseiflexaceae bacterium]
MTVLLIGGTGLLGGAIAEQLAGRDEPLRALVRTGKQVARLRELGFGLEVGDLRDPRSLRRALADVRAVITTAQGDPLKRRKRLADVDGQGNRTLIELAAAAGVEHLVFVSALKAGEGAGRVPQLAHKHAAEQALQASGLTYTILRPSSFQETFGDGFAPFKRLIERGGIGLVPGSGRGRHSFVAVRDVARAAVLALDRPEARNAVLPIGGPDDLSYPEAFAQIRSIAGRRVNLLYLPAPLLGLGGLLAAPLLPDLRSLTALLAFADQVGYTTTTPAWLIEALGQRRNFAQAVRELYAR